MSVSINQRAVSQLTDLSQSAQYVIGLLPSGTQLFSRLLLNTKIQMQFQTEIEFINDIWAGTHGSKSCFSKSLNTWVTPSSLYYLQPLELQSLHDSLASNKAPTRLNSIADKYQWLVLTDLEQIEQFKSQYSLTTSPVFAGAGLEALQQFQQKIISSELPEAIIAEALEFAEAHAHCFGGFVNMALFYLNTVGLLANNDSQRQNKISSLWQSLQPVVEQYLSAPVSTQAPDEAQLVSIQSQWLAQGDIFGFKDIYTGARIISGLEQLSADQPDQALATVSNAITKMQDFFKSVSAQDAYPAQGDGSWLYQFSNEQYQSVLQWLPGGSICLMDFAEAAVKKQAAKPNQKPRQSTRKSRNQSQPKP